MNCRDAMPRVSLMNKNHNQRQSGHNQFNAKERKRDLQGLFKIL